MSAELRLSMDLWREPRLGDESVIGRCTGPTLDIGCGPGRVAHAVAASGVPALGIDICRQAVAEARARGAAALRRDVFGDIPSAGRWHHLLLLDGNIGIGADPVRLLRRCRSAMSSSGTVMVEVEPPGVAVTQMTLRLVIDGVHLPATPWARVGVDIVGGLAAAAQLEVVEIWSVASRWFATLGRRRSHADRRPTARQAGCASGTSRRSCRELSC